MSVSTAWGRWFLLMRWPSNFTWVTFILTDDLARSRPKLADMCLFSPFLCLHVRTLKPLNWSNGILFCGILLFVDIFKVLLKSDSRLASDTAVWLKDGVIPSLYLPAYPNYILGCHPAVCRYQPSGFGSYTKRSVTLGPVELSRYNDSLPPEQSVVRTLVEPNIFSHTSLDRLSGPPSFLYSGCLGLFRGSNAAGAWHGSLASI
jgi:hypothetical protein